MKLKLPLQFVGVIALTLAVRTINADESLADLLVTNLVVANGSVTLAWTGGRPTYQVQVCTNLTAGWSNLGAPTSNTVAKLPVPPGGTSAFYRVLTDFTARYQVVFTATWSQATLPTNWPSNAHFYGLVGGIHNRALHFWRDGETASEGIRLMSELGQKTTLLNEIAPFLTNGLAQFQLSGGGISLSPGSVSYSFPQPMRRDFPLVTLVSMIAPSPDWFVGVDSLNMIENNRWLTNRVVTLYGRDAGTDSGTTYTSPDQVTVPRGVITPFTGFPALQDGVIVPFGTFTFTRLD